MTAGVQAGIGPAARRRWVWRATRGWRVAGFAITALFVAALIIGVVHRSAASGPLMTAVDPPAGMPGDTLTALGRDIGKSRVAEVYLAGARGRWKVEIVAQSRTALRFRIPARAEAGPSTLVIKTTGAPPRWIEQPASVSVRPPRAD